MFAGLVFQIPAKRVPGQARNPRSTQGRPSGVQGAGCGRTESGNPHGSVQFGTPGKHLQHRGSLDTSETGRAETHHRLAEGDQIVARAVIRACHHCKSFPVPGIASPEW